MGRGLGALQRRIIGELAQESTKRLPWEDLKRRFPREVEQRTFYRAVRSLRRQGLVYDQCGGKRPYLALTVMGDDELLDLYNQSFAMLEAAARARGVSVPSLTEPSQEPTRGHLRGESRSK